LVSVTNEEEHQVSQIKRADELLKNVRNINKGNELHHKYDLCAKTAYVAISGDEDKTGIVVHSSNLTK
jgi:hypothetical protein